MGLVKRQRLDFTEGNVWQLLIRFTIPLLIGDVFQQIYTLTDTIVVGRFVGKEALAAVGSTSATTNTIIGMFLGISVGASVVISQYYGSKDIENLSRAIHTTTTITLMLSVAFTVAGVMLTPALLRLMSTPEDVYDTALLYLRIYFAGISGLVIYNMGGGILRAIGDSQRPSYALVISTVINIALDLLLVCVFRWGVAGAAYATVAAQFGSAAYLLWCLNRCPKPYALRIKRLKLDRAIAGRVLLLGIPIGLQRMITAFSNVIVQSYINFFGSDCMAGWSAYSKVHSLAILPLENIGTAIVSYVGQNYGAKKYERIIQGVRTAWALNTLVTGTIVVAICIFTEPLIRLFNTDPSVVAYGVQFLRMLAPLFLISTINRTYAGAVRGLGDGTGPMIIMLFSYVLTRQAYLKIGTQFFNTPTFVAFGYSAGWLMASVLILVYYTIRKRRLLKHAQTE